MVQGSLSAFARLRAVALIGEKEIPAHDILQSGRGVCREKAGFGGESGDIFSGQSDNSLAQQGNTEFIIFL